MIDPESAGNVLRGSWFSGSTLVTGNPFPGLRPFDVNDSALFFGRTAQIDELMDRLQQTRFVVVVGESGCGKSSVIRAGLVPGLQLGGLPQTTSHWRIALFRPGNDPIGNLARILNEFNKQSRNETDVHNLSRELKHNSKKLREMVQKLLSPDESLLLIVDQFEELFRYHAKMQYADVGDEDAAPHFVRLLLSSSQEEMASVYVVLAMRSDFVGECAQFRGLAEALNDGIYVMPRMSREQKKEAIIGPVMAHGAAIAPRLVQRLLNDIADHPDQLPILQHALMRTWEQSRDDRSTGKPIDIVHYEAVGGIDEALNRHAEEAYCQLSEQDQKSAVKIFQRLSAIDEHGSETRRSAAMSELFEVTELDEARVFSIVDNFRARGRTFLTLSSEDGVSRDSIVDISHESLIRLWTRLRQWVIEEAASAEIYQKLAKAARSERVLYHDEDLHQAIEWQKTTSPNRAWALRYGSDFDKAMDFLRQSRQKEEERCAADARRKREIRSLTLAVIMLLIVTCLLLLMLLRSLRGEGNIANARQLVAQSDLVNDRNSDIVLRGLLATESMRYARLLENDRALRESLDVLRKPIVVLKHTENIPAPSHDVVDLIGDLIGLGRSLAVVFSPDGTWLATAAREGTARVFQAASGRLVELNHQGRFVALAFSPDGRWLATSGDDNTVRVFDVASFQQVAKLIHHGPVVSIAFSRDGSQISTASLDKTSGVFVTATGKKLMQLKHAASVTVVAFSPDSRHIATGSQDHTVRVFDLSSRRELSHLTHQQPVVSVAFSPDGRYVASGSIDMTARVLEVSSGLEVARLTHNGPVAAVTFSPDGRRVATGSFDRTARIFDVPIGREISRLTHKAPVVAISFGSDGRNVATASLDNTARIFDANNGKELAWMIHEDRVRAVAFSPDGRWVATASDDRNTQIFQTVPITETFRLSRWKPVAAAAFSVDGRLAAIGGDDKVAHIFEVSTGKEIAALVHPQPIVALSVSHNDSSVVTACSDNIVRVFNIHGGEEIARFVHPAYVLAATFNPDGSRIITGSFDGSIRILELATGREVMHFAANKGPISAVAFSPDGRLAATGSLEVRIFDALNGKELKRFFSNETVTAVLFSPDSRSLAIGDVAGTVAVFDVATGKKISGMSDRRRVGTLAFSPDGRWVAAGSDDKTATIFATSGGKQEVLIQGEGDMRTLIFGSDGNVLRTIGVDFDAATKSDFIFVQRHLLRSHDLINKACSILPRNLSIGEWKRYVGDNEPYRKTCLNLP